MSRFLGVKSIPGYVGLDANYVTRIAGEAGLCHFAQIYENWFGYGNPAEARLKAQTNLVPLLFHASRLGLS